LLILIKPFAEVRDRFGGRSSISPHTSITCFPGWPVQRPSRHTRCAHMHAPNKDCCVRPCRMRTRYTQMPSMHAAATCAHV